MYGEKPIAIWRGGEPALAPSGGAGSRESPSARYWWRRRRCTNPQAINPARVAKNGLPLEDAAATAQPGCGLCGQWGQ